MGADHQLEKKRYKWHLQLDAGTMSTSNTHSTPEDAEAAAQRKAVDLGIRGRTGTVVDLASQTVVRTFTV